MCYIAWLFGKRIPSPLVVLTYHGVKVDKLQSFKRHMDYILRAGNPIWADSGGLKTDDCREIAVTFDDGLRSVVENALPVMRDRGIPATIFVPAGYIGRKPGWECNSLDDLGVEDEVLNEAQLRGLADNFVKVGSHGVMHTKISKIDRKEAIKEVEESRKILHNILGKEVDLFAFPYGDCNEETIELCTEAGYRSVFLAVPVWGLSQKCGIVRGRIDISLDDWFLEYRLKMLGAYQWLALAIKLKRRLMSIVGVNSG